MSTQLNTDSDPDPPVDAYIRPSQLAKILGWSRPNVHYWLRRCDIKTVTIAGYTLVPVRDLSVLILTLVKAKDDAHRVREATHG